MVHFRMFVTSFLTIVSLILVLLLQSPRETESFSVMDQKQRPFAINVKFSVKDERRQEFLDVLKNNQERTLSEEPNVLQFCLGEDVDTPNIFYLHEEYKTQDDHWTTHSQTDYYDKCMEFFSTEPFSTDNVVDEFFLMHDPPSTKIPNRPGIFCLNVELCIKPEVRDEFLRVIANNKKGSDNNEPLCLQYSYGESTSKPNCFYFHEQYEGQNNGLEGFEAHTTAPHFKVWEDFASTKDPFTKPPVVQKYTITA
jgi:quinol monooxygenase YgiN